MEPESHPIPPPNRIPRNIDEEDLPVFESHGYEVCAWTPERDGKGKCEAVVLLFDIGFEDTRFKIATRFKSRKEVERLRKLLKEYANEVFIT